MNEIKNELKKILAAAKERVEFEYTKKYITVSNEKEALKITFEDTVKLWKNNTLIKELKINKNQMRIAKSRIFRLVKAFEHEVHDLAFSNAVDYIIHKYSPLIYYEDYDLNYRGFLYQDSEFAPVVYVMKTDNTGYPEDIEEVIFGIYDDRIVFFLKPVIKRK